MTTTAATAPLQSSQPQSSPASENQPEIWCGLDIPVIGATGEKSSGKTLFAASIDPRNTLCVDLEDSSATFQIPYKSRRSFYEEMLGEHGTIDFKPTQAFLWFKQLLEDIKPGEFTVLMVDPISDIESGLTDYVKANPTMFGRTKQQYEKSTGLLFGDVKTYWKQILGIASKKVKTLVFTTHMRNKWVGAKPTAQREAKGKETLFELSSLYLEMVRKPGSNGIKPDIPNAKVLKDRLVHTTIDEATGEVKHVRILPDGIPSCTPAKIREYINKPFGQEGRRVKAGEKVEPEPAMSDDEKLMLQAKIEEDKRVAAETQLAVQEGETNRQVTIEQIRARGRDKLQEKPADDGVPFEADSKPAAEQGGDTSFEPSGFQQDAKAMQEQIDASVADEEAANDLKPVLNDINELRTELKVDAASWLAALQKRGVGSVNELSLADAKGLLLSLQTLKDKRAAA